MIQFQDINVFFKKDLTVCWEWTESALEDEHHIIKHTLSLSASGPFDEDLRPPGWLAELSDFTE